MKTIACVLKLGEWKNRHMRVSYTPAHVRWLRDQVAKHLPEPHRFVCLTDAVVHGVETIPLQSNLPGWWSKMELFNEFESAFYIDLDTVIVGDLTRMVNHDHKFTILRNLSARHSKKIGSGVMAWNGDYSHLYREFMMHKNVNIATYTTSEKWGDQGFIHDHLQGWDHFQDLFPGAIQSFKFDLKEGDPKPDCSIVCFHGEPRPWQVTKSWVPEVHRG